MNQRTLLIDKWIFIGAEEYIDSKWQPSNAYVKGMTWDFYPQYFSQNKTMGNITEKAPQDNPISMAYIYNKSEQLLKIEIFTDASGGAQDQSDADTYHLICHSDKQIIRLGILTPSGASTFRYILQKMG